MPSYQSASNNAASFHIGPVNDGNLLAVSKTHSASRPSGAVTSLVLDLVAKFGEGDVLLTRREAAQFCRRSVVTLERWSRLGIGPRMVSVARRPLYPLLGLRQFLGNEDGGGKAV